MRKFKAIVFAGAALTGVGLAPNRGLPAEESPPSVWRQEVVLRDANGNPIAVACVHEACFFNCCWDDPHA